LPWPNPPVYGKNTEKLVLGDTVEEVWFEVIAAARIGG
jgi:hypothetical protein